MRQACQALGIMSGTEKALRAMSSPCKLPHLTQCLLKAFSFYPLVALGLFNQALGHHDSSRLPPCSPHTTCCLSLFPSSLNLVAMEDRHSKCPGESWDNKRCLVPFDQNISPATVSRAPARPGRGRAMGRPVQEEDQSCVQPRQAPTAGCAELFSGPADFTVDKEKAALTLES